MQRRPLSTLIYRAGSLAFAALLAVAAQGAELGDISVRSYIGQPLSADIELVALTQDDVNALQAKLARPNVYQGANISMNPALATVQLSVVRRDQRQFLHVATTRPIDADYVHLFIELSAAGRQDVRAATVWLQADPNPAPPPISAATLTPSDAAALTARVRAERAAAAQAARPAAPVAAVAEQAAATPVPIRNRPAPMPSAHESEVGPPGVSLKSALAAPAGAAPARQRETLARVVRSAEKTLHAQAEKPAVEKPAAEKLSAEKPASEKPPAEKAGIKKPAVEKALIEKPAIEKTAIEKPAIEKTLVEKPVVEKPIAEKLRAAPVRPAAATPKAPPVAASPAAPSPAAGAAAPSQDSAASDNAVPLRVAQALLPMAPMPLPRGLKQAPAPAACPANTAAILAQECVVLDKNNAALLGRLAVAESKVKVLEGALTGKTAAAHLPTAERGAAVRSAPEQSASAAATHASAASQDKSQGKAPGKSSSPAAVAQAASLEDKPAGAAQAASSSAASAAVTNGGRVLPKLKYKKEKPVEQGYKSSTLIAGGAALLLMAAAITLYLRKKKAGMSAPLKIWQGWRKKKPADAAAPQAAQESVLEPQ